MGKKTFCRLPIILFKFLFKLGKIFILYLYLYYITFILYNLLYLFTLFIIIFLLLYNLYPNPKSFGEIIFTNAVVVSQLQILIKLANSLKCVAKRYFDF